MYLVLTEDIPAKSCGEFGLKGHIFQLAEGVDRINFIDESGRKYIAYKHEIHKTLKEATKASERIRLCT